MAHRELSPLEQVMSLLGLARRARILLVGQDKVFAALKEGGDFLVLTTNDAAPNVMRHVRSTPGRNTVRHVALETTDRNALGAQLGVGAAQIAAMPSDNGLAIKILNILENQE